MWPSDQQDSELLAQALIHELFDDVEDLDKPVLNALVESLSAWMVENRLKTEGGF